MLDSQQQVQAISEYNVATGRDSGSLALTVNSMIEDGWHPWGSALVTKNGAYVVLYQPMVKIDLDLVVDNALRLSREMEMRVIEEERANTPPFAIGQL